MEKFDSIIDEVKYVLTEIAPKHNFKKGRLYYWDFEYSGKLKLCRFTGEDLPEYFPRRDLLDRFVCEQLDGRKDIKGYDWDLFIDGRQFLAKDIYRKSIYEPLPIIDCFIERTKDKIYESYRYGHIHDIISIFYNFYHRKEIAELERKKLEEIKIRNNKNEARRKRQRERGIRRVSDYEEESLLELNLQLLKKQRFDSVGFTDDYEE